MLQTVTIGFSTRALAEALNTVGISPISLDAFGDQDCQNHCLQTMVVQDWGTSSAVTQIVDSLTTISQQLHLRPAILYAGGIENWPELAQALDANFTVLGPSAGQLQLLRCPDRWRAAAELCDLQFPETTKAVPETIANWLAKPYLGAGGLRIHRSTPETQEVEFLNPATQNPEFYHQRFVEGRVLGIHCIIRASGSELLGITESWSSCDWPGPTEFIYRGSWGPIELAPDNQARVLRLGNYLHATTGHVGWIEFDMIADASGRLWLLEINPRWTAGMEILTNSGTASPIQSHLDAFSFLPPLLREAQSAEIRKPPHTICAKAVFYAPKDVVLTRSLLQNLNAKSSLRDIPSLDAEGQVIREGHPLLTLSAEVPAFVTERKSKLLERLKQERLEVEAFIDATTP